MKLPPSRQNQRTSNANTATSQMTKTCRTESTKTTSQSSKTSTPWPSAWKNAATARIVIWHTWWRGSVILCHAPAKRIAVLYRWKRPRRHLLFLPWWWKWNLRKRQVIVTVTFSNGNLETATILIHTKKYTTILRWRTYSAVLSTLGLI